MSAISFREQSARLLLFSAIVAMIDAKDTERELEQIRANNRILAKTLDEGREAEAMKVRELARDLFR